LIGLRGVLNKAGAVSPFGSHAPFTFLTLFYSV